MGATDPHNTIITREARVALRPLGLKQRGRSRLWYADHGWWGIVVEFQPSSWSKGSYLNVGASWLWPAKDLWTFDFGYRVKAHVKYRDDTQFSDAVRELAALAACEVARYRATVTGVRFIAESEDLTGPSGDWGAFHRAVALALTGDGERALSSIAQVQARLQGSFTDPTRPLERALVALSSVATSREDTHLLVSRWIHDTRRALKLDPWSGEFS